MKKRLLVVALFFLVNVLEEFFGVALKLLLKLVFSEKEKLLLLEQVSVDKIFGLIVELHLG